MITSINNKTEKSFINYSGPQQEFSNINVIFGYNGRGKTSLSKMIVEEFKEKNEEENFRIFNKDYIEENLVLEEGEKLKGLKVNFGDKAKIETEIKKLKAEKVDAKPYEEQLKKEEDVAEARIREIFKERKGKLKIQEKNHADVLKKYDYHISDYKSVKNKKSDKEFKDLYGDDRLEKKLEQISKVKIEEINIDGVKNKFLEIKQICEQIFSEEKIPSSELIEWLQNGIHLHENNDKKCHFCGSEELIVEEIKSRIKKYSSNKRQQSRVLLNEYINDMEILEDSLNRFKQYITQLEIFFDEDYSNTFKDIKNLKNNILKIKAQIISKNKNLDEVVIITDLREDLVELSNISSTINQRRNQYIRTLNSDISNLNNLVKGAIGKEIKEDSSLEVAVSQIKENREEINNIQNQNKQIDNKIEELKSSQSKISDFSELLNSFLESLGVHLCLVPDDNEEHYLLKKSYEKDSFNLSINDISEGEKNILALLYFYFELFEDKEQNNFKSTIRLLVIDDPISSMDSSNRYGVLQLLQELSDKIKSSNCQLFYFTHVWEDFSDMGYGKQDEYHFYQVYKDNNQNSQVRKIKKIEVPYKKLFKEVYDLSRKSLEEINNCDIYHLPNNMRRIVEEFISFKNGNGIIPTKKNIPILKKIFKIDSGTKARELNELITFINVLSHRAERRPDEVKKNAKYLMKFIRRVDQFHYDAMKQ